MNTHLEPLEEQTTILQAEPTFSSDTKTANVEPKTTTSKDYQSEKVRVEEFQISAEYLVAKVQELIRQGNLRRLVIKNSQGRTLLDVPLVAGAACGLVGLTLFPIAAAATSIAALAARISIAVERKE